MSLLDELSQNGVSAEDLEKAASVRLFEKVAASDGVDLSKLNEEQREQLFAHFIENVLPGMLNEEQAAQPVQAGDAEKAASVMLFQKVAADENVNLSKLNEEQLEQLYAHFLENVVPGMVQPAEETKAASAEEVEEAQAKLAEAEILGRHMARAYVDELQKTATKSVMDPAEALLGPSFMEVLRNASTGASSGPAGKFFSKGGLAHNIGRGVYGATDWAQKHPGTAGIIGASGLGAAGLGAGALGLGAYLKGRSTGKKKGLAKGLAQGLAQAEADKHASLFDKLATDRANEILAESGVAQESAEPSFDDLVNARAVEILKENGYTFQE